MANPSLAIIPSAYKVEKVYAVLPENGDGDGDFSRASTANRINKDGIIEEMAINVPRIDYSDGGCPVLLLEPQATNLYLNSAIMVTQNVTTTAQSYTVQFRGLGTITFSGSYVGSLVGTGVNDLVSLTFTATAGTLTSTITGDVTNGQCETGTYASSWILTEGTTVTRAQDTSTNYGTVDDFNSEEGVIFSTMSNITDNGNIYGLCLEGGGARISLRYSISLSQINILVVWGGTQVNASYQLPGGQEVEHDFAFTYKQDDFRLYVDGVQVIVDTSGNVPPPNTINKFDFDDGSIGKFYGRNKAVKVYKSISSAIEDGLTYLTP